MKVLAGILSIVAGVIVGCWAGWSPICAGFYAAFLYMVLRQID